MKIYRGALIGCGYFAQYHLEAWRRMPNVRLVAACDLSLERAHNAAEAAYTSAERMLDSEQLDFVDIVTRSETHLDLISVAAQRGLAITCQKPLAPDWETALRIAEVASARHVRIMIHDNWRWQPWYRAAREIVARGEIGTPICYGFRCRWNDGGGVLPYPKQPYFRKLHRLLIDETLVHHIDTARFLFGDISTIYAEARRHNHHICGEDHAILTLRHANSVMGSIDGHRFLRFKDPGPSIDEATFEGDSGSIRVTNMGEVWSGHEKIWSNDCSSGYRGDSVYTALNHFIQCLESGYPFESEVSEYVNKTFAVVEAAYTSVESHRCVELAEFVSAAS